MATMPLVQVGKMKLPILMYHDIVGAPAAGSLATSHESTPFYNLSKDLFEKQLLALHENGYQGISLENAATLTDDEGKFVVLTFDDGLAGNFEHALPILKRFNFKATFFVVTGSIGTAGFMSWEELSSLLAEGMSVQPHTASHRSLQILSDHDIWQELHDSKTLLEDRLPLKVNSMSFPHGSYNDKIIKIAAEQGYEYLCTSEFKPTYHNSLAQKPSILGRITVTNKMSNDKLLKLVEYDAYEYMKMQAAKGAKNLVKKTIGINNYRRIYRRLFNIKVQS